MAFSRSFLKSSGLTDEQIAAVMEEHVAVTDALKEQIKGYKADAEKLPQIQQELEALKDGEDWKKKYEDEHKALEDFKTKTAQDAEAAKVRAAYREFLTQESIPANWLDRVMESTDFSGVKLDEEGKLVDADKHKEALQKKWGDVKTTVQQRGAQVDKPPQTGNGKMTREELDKKLSEMKDSSARQKLIAENLNLFGKG